MTDSNGQTPKELVETAIKEEAAILETEAKSEVKEEKETLVTEVENEAKKLLVEAEALLTKLSEYVKSKL